MEIMMFWTEAARCNYARRGPLYSSDLTDEESALISPFLHESMWLVRCWMTHLWTHVNAIHCLILGSSVWSLRFG